MKVDLSRIEIVPTCVGLVIWAALVAAIWLFYREASAVKRENDFRTWKALNDRPQASFGEFLADESSFSGRRSYLSSIELTIVTTLLALLLLLSAFRSWRVVGW